MKEASDSRTTRGNSLGFSRGGKFAVGSDRRVLQSGLPHATYNGIFFDCGMQIVY